MKNLQHLACALALLAASFVWPMSAEARINHRVAHHVRVHQHVVRHARGIYRHSRPLAYAPFNHFTAPASKAISIAMHYLGSGNPTHKSGPWCGHFMNFIEHKAGRPGIASGLARDWARYGHRSGPVAGAIVVFSGHVGRVIARVGNQIKVISGNYSHRVGIGMYSIRSAIAFRMP